MGTPGYAARSSVDIAALAARAALDDALGADRLRSHVYVLSTTRTFDDSLPGKPAFGRSTN